MPAPRRPTAPGPALAPLLAWALLLAPPGARARGEAPLPAEAAGSVTAEREVDAAAGPPRAWVQLRMGASAGGGAGRPYVCGEVAPLDVLSVEGCGSGSGLWHRDPGPEMSHYRAKLRLASLALGGGALQGLAGLGFAELQVGEDAAGFYFGTAGPRGTETAGPEGVAALRFLRPVGLGFELVAEASLALAWFAAGPALSVPTGPLQPAAALTLGLAF